MATVRVGDIDVYFEEHGDASGEVVLLIMGYACNAAAWAPQIPALVEAGYRVIAFDNRGAGRTTQPEGAYSIPQMADDAAGLLDAIGIIGAVHVVGASMGGMIAQEFALRHPSRVRTLTLMCTTPGGPKSFGYAEMVANGKLLDDIKDLSELATPERMQEGIDVMFTPEFMKAPGAGFQAMITSSIMYPSTLAGLRGQVAAIASHDTVDRLGEIRVPTFVTAGEDDTLVDARNSPLLAERIRGARLRMFPGQRHGFTAEVPEAVNSALIEFLADARAKPVAGEGLIERIKGLFRRSADRTVSRPAS
jgi:pimeloyl-ACP methyl ester carboxylesterase